MIVDVHSHIMWYPEHVSENWAREALASKLVKLKFSDGRAHAARLDLHSYDATQDDHWKAAQQADKVVVFGLQAKAAGAWVPNELIADYARQHPDKIIGWASVDPNEPDCIEQLEYAVNTLGLRGLKLGPAYQHFDPADRKHWPFYSAVQRLGIPVMWHQGTTFPSRAKLKWANPIQLEDVAMDFPDIRMVIAHLGHPWEEDVVALIRKAPNLYSDISAVHYRPWRYWQAMVTAMEYGVTHKLLLASDFPSATIDNVIAGLRNVNAPVEGTKLPQIPTEIQDRIISENWKDAFPEYM
ncbi:MAG TPA: amidohydrolase family protein [Candidatus Saccharimonadales bacterium]|nr:amidohydrolase family protein [Candidatus Saccharimonadales bacterium]